MSKEKLYTYLEINDRTVHYDNFDEKIIKLKYQKEFLNRIYKKCGLLSVHEYLDVTNKQYGLYSFISLLQFYMNTMNV